MSYPSADPYSAHPSASSPSNGDVDIDAFPMPPNLRSMSMSLSDQPIVDPDFGWFDSYPTAPFSDFSSSSPASSSSGSVPSQYDWYDPLPPPAPQPPQQQQQPVASGVGVAYTADGVRPHPAHASHNGGGGVGMPQPAHGLAPIIPPQQRPIPPPSQHPSNYAHMQQQPVGKAEFQQPPYPQPHSRQPPLYEQPPQYQHSASFPPPSYPPQHQPPHQPHPLPHQPQQQHNSLAQPYNTHHARRASTPASSTPYAAYATANTPVPYSGGGRQAMYGAEDHSPVSHVSSISSHSSHSSSSSDGGGVADGMRHKRKQSSDSTAGGEGNGTEHTATEGIAAAKGGRGRAASQKKQKASTTNNNTKAKANTKTAPTTTSTAVTAKRSDSSPTTPATAAPSSSVGDCWSGNPTAITSVHGSVDKGDPTTKAWPLHTSAAYANMQQYFVSLILAVKQPDATTITDIIHLIAHAMEVAPAQSFSYVLRRLGYTPQPAADSSGSGGSSSGSGSDDGEEKRVVWRSSNPNLPYMTLPHRFRLNWSVSPETTQPEDTTAINFPMLMWWRSKEARFVRRADGFVQAIETAFYTNPAGTPPQQQQSQQPQPADSPSSVADSTTATPTSMPTPTPQTPATPSTEPATPTTTTDPSTTSSSPSSSSASLPPSAIDMSVLDLPCHVEVNAAFERMFGYSQSEIRILFIRHGKQALARLADAQQFRQCHELSMRDACEGQQEFSHVIDVRPKYGGTMRTVMHQKLVVGGEGLVWKKLYMWIPVTKQMKDAYHKMTAPAASAAAGGGGGGGGGAGVAEMRNGGSRVDGAETEKTWGA